MKHSSKQGVSHLMNKYGDKDYRDPDGNFDNRGAIDITNYSRCEKKPG